MTTKDLYANSVVVLSKSVCLGLCVGLVGCSDRGPSARSSSERVGSSVAPLSTSSAATTWSTIQVLTWPAAQCTVDRVGGPNDGVPVIADDLGVAQFGAVPAGSHSAVNALSLDCHDDSGRSQSYPIDLTSSATFQPLPANALPPDPRPVRPALTGDPMSYSVQELVGSGYGIRPDPVADAHGYQLWLETATKPIRMVKKKSVHLPSKASTSITRPLPPPGGGWSGAEFRGDFDSPEVYFDWAVYSFVVPTFTINPGCQSTGMWGGLGGDVAEDLIQCGVQAFIHNGAIAYNTFKEYMSGDDVCPDGCSGPSAPCCTGYATQAALGFNTTAGDAIIGESWACDQYGNVTHGGGYGCFFLVDDYTGEGADCSTPSSSCASLAAINTYNGQSAEAIFEDNAYSACGGSGTYAQWSGWAAMTFEAEDTSGNYHNWGNDSVFYDIDSVNSSNQTVGIGTAYSGTSYGAYGTTFYWSQGS
jgi:hypothetical protein